MFFSRFIMISAFLGFFSPSFALGAKCDALMLAVSKTLDSSSAVSEADVQQKKIDLFKRLVIDTPTLTSAPFFLALGEALMPYKNLPSEEFTLQVEKGKKEIAAQAWKNLVDRTSRYKKLEDFESTLNYPLQGNDIKIATRFAKSFGLSFSEFETVFNNAHDPQFLQRAYAQESILKKKTQGRDCLGYGAGHCHPGH
jgi:hypothetical protein